MLTTLKNNLYLCNSNRKPILNSPLRVRGLFFKLTAKVIDFNRKITRYVEIRSVFYDNTAIFLFWASK